jgi:hypothetical protein
MGGRGMNKAEEVLKQIVEDWRCYLIGVGASYPPDQEEYTLMFERMAANITDAESL